MKAQDMFNAVRNAKGQTLKVCICSPVKTLKGVESVVLKTTETYAIAGIELGNRKEVIEAIAAGERGELGPLPWGAWRKGFYPFIIDHTPKGQTENVEYFRLYPPTRAQAETFNLIPRVVFTIDGKEATREEATVLCGSNAKASEDRADCFSVRCENVVSIG